MEDDNLIDYITPKQAATLLEISYIRVLELIWNKCIDAEKVKGKWQINRMHFEELKQINHERVEKLKARYVSLYWEGLDPERIEKHVREDFKQRGIIHNQRGFATLAIFESLAT